MVGLMQTIIYLENVHFVGINKKFISRNYVISQEYRNFYDLLFISCLSIKINPPYDIEIIMSTYLDIDAILKGILDVLKKKEVIEDDRFVLRLTLTKTPIKRNLPSSLKVSIQHHE